MTRLSCLVLCTALITFPAFAYEGPQEQALDKSLAETQGQDSITVAGATKPSPAATNTTSQKKYKKAAATTSTAPGPDERRMDQGLQPDDKPDPQAAEIRKLNGG